MLDFRNRSKIRFESEMKKLLKDLYVSALDRAEKILRPNKQGEAWKQFRFGILNLGNDKIRQLSDRLEDYSIEFRPGIFSVEYTVDVPASKLVEFDFHADITGVYFQIVSTDKNVIFQIEKALACNSEVTSISGEHTLKISGLYSVFHKVIPFFDQNECFKGKTLERYNEWKEKVYAVEKDNA